MKQLEYKQFEQLISLLPKLVEVSEQLKKNPVELLEQTIEIGKKVLTISSDEFFNQYSKQIDDLKKAAQSVNEIKKNVDIILNLNKK